MLHYATLGSEGNLNMKVTLLTFEEICKAKKNIVDLFGFTVYYMDSIKYTQYS